MERTSRGLGHGIRPVADERGRDSFAQATSGTRPSRCGGSECRCRYFLACGLAAVIRAGAGEVRTDRVRRETDRASSVRDCARDGRAEPRVPRIAEAAEVVAEPVRLLEEPPIPFAEQMAALCQDLEPVRTNRSPRQRSEPQQIVRSKSRRTHVCDADLRYARRSRPSRALEPLALTNAPRALAAHAGAAGDSKAGDLHGYAQPMELNAATSAPSMDFALGGRTRDATGSGQRLFGAQRRRSRTRETECASAAAVEALELQSETSSPSLQLTSQSLELNLRPAPGCRYDVQIQPGPIQQAGSEAGDEISTVPEPEKQLAAQSLELGLGIGGPCVYPVQSAAGTTVPAGLC